MKGAVALGAVLSGASGCTLPDFLSHPPTTPPGQTPGQADAPSSLSVTAVPGYRLVVSPTAVDSPSRLLVIQVELSTTDDRALSVTLDDLALVLPTGERRSVFDRGRAMELVRRATLADADLSYLLRSDGHPPGGLSEYARPQLTDMVMSNLLTDRAFTSEHGMRGFVVVDTGVPLMSLDGASIEVTAYHLSGSTPVRGVYQFATAPTAVEAH